MGRRKPLATSENSRSATQSGKQDTTILPTYRLISVIRQIRGQARDPNLLLRRRGLVPTSNVVSIRVSLLFPDLRAQARSLLLRPLAGLRIEKSGTWEIWGFMGLP